MGLLLNPTINVHPDTVVKRHSLCAYHPLLIPRAPAHCCSPTENTQLYCSFSPLHPNVTPQWCCPVEGDYATSRDQSETGSVRWSMPSKLSFSGRSHLPLPGSPQELADWSIWLLPHFAFDLSGAHSHVRGCLSQNVDPWDGVECTPRTLPRISPFPRICEQLLPMCWGSKSIWGGTPHPISPGPFAGNPTTAAHYSSRLFFGSRNFCGVWCSSTPEAPRDTIPPASSVDPPCSPPNLVFFELSEVCQ